ncbi:MAG TPA: hypothetical protein VFJ51_08830 [Nitrososphaeraceae archaeon]|nr:hypothetical protein [Nitrososphaeraceae archaeon]
MYFANVTKPVLSVPNAIASGGLGYLALPVDVAILILILHTTQT